MGGCAGWRVLHLDEENIIFPPSLVIPGNHPSRALPRTSGQSRPSLHRASNETAFPKKRHTIPLRTGRTQWCLSSPKRSAARRGVARIGTYCRATVTLQRQHRLKPTGASARSTSRLRHRVGTGWVPYRVPPINRHSVIGLAGGWAHRRKCEKRETAAIAHTSLHAQSATRVTAADQIHGLRIAASPAWGSSA